MLVVACQGVIIDHLGAIVNRLGAAADHLGAAPRPKRLSLRDVLIVEAINLDVWIFTPAPRS
jgi:hypothetical protein